MLVFRQLADLHTQRYDNFDLKDLLQQAIQKLNPEMRSVVVLRLIDGYSVEETAKILDLPQGTVASRLARAQVKLKEWLQPIFNES